MIYKMRYLSRLWWERNACRVLVVNFEGKRRPEKYGSSWENNIKIELKEIWWYGVVWFHLAQNRDKHQALVRG